MLYPTHKRYGILFGFLTFPVGVAIGLVPTLTETMRASDLTLVVMCCYMAMRGALFGARFPDIDTPNSRPAKKHPIIRKIFAFFHLKHRGKFSHDLATQTAFWGIILFFVSHISDRWLNSLVGASNLWLSVTALTALCFVWFVSLDIVDVLKWGADLVKSQKYWAILNRNRFKIGACIGGILTVLLMISGVFDVSDALLFQTSLSSALKSATILISSFKVYILFTWAGVYSHLIADMVTKSGISIFGIPIAPAKVVLQVRKIPVIGVLLVPTDFRTGSKWEDMHRYGATILCIPAFIWAFYVVTGFQVVGT